MGNWEWIKIMYDEIEREYNFRRQTMHYKFNIGTAASLCVIFIGFSLWFGVDIVNAVGATISIIWLIFSIYKLKETIESRNGKPEKPISDKSLLDD